MAAKAGHTEGGRYKPQAGSQMASPNVIPMADIMLVTPMLQKTKPVDLARTNTAKDMQEADRDDSIVVAVTRDGNIFLGNTQVQKTDLSGQVKDRIANKQDKTVFLKSDARAKYGDVVAIVDEIRSAGVDQLGLLTERNERTGQPPPPPPPAGD
jgi:biopolymer transport protein ExbD